TPSGGPILASWDQELTLPVEIVPPGTATVQLLHDETVRSAVEQAITSMNTSVALSPDGRISAQGQLKCGSIPVSMACRIFWRIADPSAPGGYGEVAFQAFEFVSGRSFGYGGVVPPGFAAARVDVIIRPDIQEAAKSE